MPVTGVYAKRRQADLDKLRELERMMPGVLNILGVTGSPPEKITLRINLPTASNSSYPSLKQLSTEAEISFPDRYPFHSGPVVRRILLKVATRDQKEVKFPFSGLPLRRSARGRGSVRWASPSQASCADDR